MSDHEKPDPPKRKRKRQQQRKEKKKNKTSSKRKIPVRPTSRSIVKKAHRNRGEKKVQDILRKVRKKSAQAGGIRATNGATVIATGGTDGISIVCASSTTNEIVRRARSGQRASYPKKTKPFRKMRVDWGANVARIDGRTMTIDKAIEEGYMTSDGATVGQENGCQTRVFNFL